MDTICAPATSPYESAIGILRLSGKESLPILKSIFHTKQSIVPRMMHYGHIVQEDKVLDEVYGVYFPGPYSYTTEDVVEIHCHGGRVSMDRILRLLLSKGARLAKPGEFTQRAFLNGRLDLTQAEAVMDLVSAKTELSFDVALDHLGGATSKEIHKLREDILQLLAEIAVSIDYPEEDIPEISYSTIEETLENSIETLKRILRDSLRAKRIKYGIRTAIVGKTNVGKSSLLNFLSGKDRSIVTDIEGTTRDTIEEEVLVEGILLTLIDTAGLRETEDIVEQLGVQRSREAIESSEMIFFVIDGSRELHQDEIEMIEEIKNPHMLLLINKTDLPTVVNLQELEKMVPKDHMIEISAKEGKGLEEIVDRIKVFTEIEEGIRQHPLISSARQLRAIEEALEHAGFALEQAKLKIPYDYLEIDIRECYDQLGSVVGEELRGDLVGEIFSRFCIGK